MLEARALNVFVVLADELHFGRAAARMGVAQSVVSTQLLRLEDRLGTRLMERGRRLAVKLTPVGETFIVEARASLDQLRRTEQIGQLAGRGEAGHVSLGYVFSAATSGVLSNSLAVIRHNMSELIIAPEPMETPEQINAISNGHLDIGFIRPRPSYPANVAVHVVHRETMVLAMSCTHTLAEHRIIEPDALAQETFVVPQFGEASGFADHVRRLGSCGGFRPAPFIETRDFVTAISISASEQAISLVPQSIGKLMLDGVVFREISGYADQVELALIWRCTSSERLVSVIISAFDEHMTG